MKLNAREQLVLVVVLVILVWVGGFVAFIKPSIDAVREASNTLSDKEMELATKQQIIKDDENLDEDVEKAYAKATETANIFYPRMIQHKAATIMQAELDLDNDIKNGYEVQNLDLALSNLGASTVNRYVYIPSNVQTNLDTIVSKVTPAEGEAVIVQNNINMTAYSFSFNFTTTKKDLMQFLANLQSNEHKSIVVNGLNIGDVGENKEDTEWSGSMSLTMYMVPELPKVEEVDKKDDAAKVDAVAE